MREQVGCEKLDWKVYPMFCPNCGTKIYGFKNKEELIKYNCEECRFVSVRKEMGRRHASIEVYAPRNQVSAFQAL